MGKKQPKQPGFAADLARLKADQKKAASVADPEAYRSQTPLWSFKEIALEGQYSWASMDTCDRRDAYSALKSYETMRWNEIEQVPHCHSAEAAEMDARVRAFLAQHCPYVESMFQLKIGSKGRVFGVRVDRVYQIVIWDGEHEAFPTQLRHT